MSFAFWIKCKGLWDQGQICGSGFSGFLRIVSPFFLTLLRECNGLDTCSRDIRAFRG